MGSNKLSAQGSAALPLPADLQIWMDSQDLSPATVSCSQEQG